MAARSDADAVTRYTLTASRRYNIGRGQLAPALVRDGELDLRWGLLAPWRGHGGKRGPNIYEATIDTIDKTPVLRTARAKRRCIVRADGWFAWRKLGTKRQPYWIHAPADSAHVGFAGVVASHGDDGIASFALVVVPAAGIVAPIAPSEGMPAIVDARWLDDPELHALPLDGWRADAVSSHVDNAAHDDPGCIAPLGNPAQGELF